MSNITHINSFVHIQSDTMGMSHVKIHIFNITY